jgi:tRNA dimethylallyltransferase
MEELSKNRALCAEARAGWFLTGATACGKTAVSLHLAKLLNAEIISLDSMSIYRGMDLGTAKPSRSDREEIPHHLIDILDPIETFSVSQYRDLAMSAIREIRSRGREVLFVGGSALYLKAMLRGIFEGPPADWELRRQIEKEASEVGEEQLYERLKLVDPVTAHRLHVNDRRRIIRALEVLRLSGKPISHWQLEFDFATPPDKCRVFSLRRPRQELHVRIENRVRRMFESGLVDEVRTLIDRWGSLSHTASQAVGYFEVIGHLNGTTDLAQTFERVLVRTRKFARHQETWFRGLSECRILELVENDLPEEIAARILDMGLVSQAIA